MPEKKNKKLKSLKKRRQSQRASGANSRGNNLNNQNVQKVVKQVRKQVHAEAKKIAEKTLAKKTKSLDKRLKEIGKMDAFDAGSALIEEINKRFDFKANSGQAVDFPLNTVAMSQFIDAWIDRVCRLTPLVVQSQVKPSDLAMFAWMSTIIHIRNAGQLGGDTTKLPQFTNDMILPVPIATIISYLGKYQQHDQNLVSSYVLPDGFMDEMINFAELDPKKSYPFPVFDGKRVYDALTLDNISIKEYTADRSWTPLTVSAWCSTRLYLVQNALRALNIPVVPMKQVPLAAPGPEAYCCRGYDQVHFLSPIPNRVFSLVTPVDWEIATVFSQGRLKIVQQTWRSFPISTPSFIVDFGYGIFTTEQYLAAGIIFFLMNQIEYKPGRIRQVYKLGNARLKTFAWNVKYITGSYVQQQLAIVYRQLQQQIEGFTDLQSSADDTGYQQLYALHVLVSEHLVARCEQSSPMSQQTLQLTTTAGDPYAPMAFYTPVLLETVALPPNVIEFIESLGVVVSDGAMVVPLIPTQLADPKYTWGNGAFIGNMIEMSWKGLNYDNLVATSPDHYPFPWLGTTVLKPHVNTTEQIWDTTFGALYEASTTTRPYPVQHPNFTLDTFIEIWKKATSSQHFNNLTMSLVTVSKSKLIKMGEGYQMLTSAYGTTTRRIGLDVTYTLSNPAPVAPKKKGVTSVPPTPELYVDSVLVNYVGSSMVLNRAELHQATILPAVNAYVEPTTAATSTFLCKMNSVNTVGLLEDAVSKTFQSGMVNSSPAKDNNVKLLTNGELVPTKEPESKSPSVWDRVIHTLGEKLVPPAAGVAGALACDAIPIFGELLSPICASGASALATTFLSRGGVVAQHNPPTRQQLDSVKAGVAKLGSAIKSTGGAIDQASTIVSRFAVSQVKGIDYGKALQMARAGHR